MALGSVSMSAFAPGELEALTGTVSIVPFTRAEFENMLKKAMYSEGKLVFTGVLKPQWRYGDSLSIPTEVDYVVVGGIKLTRGGSGKGSGHPDGYPNVTSYTTISFSSNTLSASCYSPNNCDYMTLNVEGYHYY